MLFRSVSQSRYRLSSAKLGVNFQDKLANSVFDNNGELRWAASSKLLQMLGYGRFDYQNMTPTQFSDRSVSGMSHLPNVSIFRLLAYQKICNDHYQFRQWQGYDASLCNVDYVKPSASMDLSSHLDQVNFTSGANANSLNFLDLRFSNLPLDYLNGVLPTAQFGSESVVSLGSDVSSLDGKLRINTDPGTASTALVVRRLNNNGIWEDQIHLNELKPIPGSSSLEAFQRDPSSDKDVSFTYDISNASFTGLTVS